MNTITIDSKTYDRIALYAKQNSISVTEAVVAGLNSFLEKFKTKQSPSQQQYYISPEVKALEVGFKCPSDLSDDYKNDYKSLLSEKFL